MAFVMRFFSPIFPDLYAHPQDHFALDNCVVNTPVNSQASTGSLCGLGYPYQRGYPSNGSYAPAHGEIFDEVYFGDFAHQDLVGQYYFDPEPPLGKLIIASGEWLYGWWRATFEHASGSYADLGFTPFGFRIMGVLFGSLVIPLLYLLALRLWPNRLFAAAAALLACFDGMFFVQSRIGMIDIFPIFFILLAYWVFHLHLDSPTPRSSIISLLATGVVVGLAVAAKWIALAALATMVLILAVRVLRRLVDVRQATAGGSWAWGRSEAVGPALPGAVRAATYLPVAVLAFLVIPFLIYYASWWPNFFQHGYFKTFSDFWNYQVSAYVYHATLTASHPYGSPWYSWPFLYRPVAYYWEGQGLGVDANTGQPLVAGLINLGNPWTWWTAIPCLLAMPYFAIRHRSYAAAFILLAFLTQYLPWSQISRVLFLYHMFGSLPFMFLALAFVLAKIGELGELRIGQSVLLRAGDWRAIAYTHLAIAVLAFIYFYPVWTAIPIGSSDYLLGWRHPWWSGWPLGHMWVRTWI